MMIDKDYKQCAKTPCGLYVHIPFCIKKCGYCDFLSMLAKDTIKAAYLKALEQDLEQSVKSGELQGRMIETVFIGGGTPSALPEKLLEELCNILNKWISFRSDMEITMECNPGTMSLEKLDCLRQGGINRLSFGLQSASDEELRLLGRIHTYEEFLQNYEAARRVGFSNINIDIMSALPGQTKDSYHQTLERVAALEPQHVSAYSLLIEEGTLFFERYGKEALRRSRGEPVRLLPDEETERSMYEETNQYLARYGYQRYEISNYAKPGYESRHNCGYWTGKEYVGVGLGASSYIGFQRFHKTRRLKDYLGGDFGPYEAETLTERMRMEEFMFLGLRMIKGISIKRFRELFSKDIFEVYGRQLETLFSEKLLAQTDADSICLTKRGLDIGNYVFEQFLL